MINVYDKLWYVVQDNQREPDSTLAYMCQYVTAESGEVASNVKKMQNTGRSWAKISDKKDLGVIIDNTPTKGLYVGCSVSRWSTSNKLFRVTDPRGFTVEIPTDNLATLLHHTTVIKGVVQEECVWGRYGNNHILLPINSEPYNQAKKDKDTLDNKLIPVSDLKVGDWVKFFGSETEYYFLGRVKITWNVRGVRRVYCYNWSSIGKKEDEHTDWYKIEDNKYTNFFVRKYLHSNEKDYYAETPNKPKITRVIRNEVLDVDLKSIGWLSSPERVDNQLSEFIDTRYYDRTDSEILSIKQKGE